MLLPARPAANRNWHLAEACHPAYAEIVKIALVHLFLIVATCLADGDAGAWPEPRQNPRLTAIQPMRGKMKEPPVIIADYELDRTPPSTISTKLPSGKTVRLAAANGELRCYESNGSLRWKIHPPELNFTKVIACDDFDGDGKFEAAVEAGRPAQPFGAVALVAIEDGRLLWSYNVEPMSYDWHLYAGQYLPGTARPQLVVLMHGYPPDERKGYITLFDCPDPGAPPTQKWRHDFEVYTCFPSLLQADLDGNGTDEIAVETHSKMWLFDAPTGRVKQYVAWDVSPANERSYGLVEFVDLNRDGLKDFLCVANFAKHFEVLLNEKGTLKKAWHHGWEDSVTTSTMALTWPLPPYADVDGDGDLELVVSIFAADGEPRWSMRVYDAQTGKLQAQNPGMVAQTLSDLNGDGAFEILAATATDRAGAQPDGGYLPDARGGAHLIDGRGPVLKNLWSDVSSIPLRVRGEARIQRGGKIVTLELLDDCTPRETLWAPTTPPSTDAPIRADIAAPPALLAANLVGDVRNELILHHDGKVTILRLQNGRFEKAGEYRSSCPPAIGDFDGDNQNELVLTDIATTHPASVKVVTPADEDKTLWQTTVPAPAGGFPAPRPGYTRTGRFTGKSTPDLYFSPGQPAFASVLLDGQTGNVVWSAANFDEISRPAGPTQNHASAYDCNGDGTDDLVFTAPDYFCVLSGDAGKLLAGPSLPATIFKQPSQGLYTFPAVLERSGDQPLVALVGGHYFQGMMSLSASPLWHALPVVGQARSGHEGFLRASEPARTKDRVAKRERWLMGYGRQNGRFACVDVADGAVRWELDLAATSTDVATCDVDGDGSEEFVFGTSHGALYAVGDGSNSPRIVWKIELGAALGPPILADLTGDGATDIALATYDGSVLLLTGKETAARVP